MCVLSDVCRLPESWQARKAQMEQKREVTLCARLAWQAAKREERDRFIAYKKREEKRAKKAYHVSESLSASRQKVREYTMPDAIEIEGVHKMFHAGKGERATKKVKNRVYAEQCGSVPRRIVLKRFDNSRITCLCKSAIY